MTATFPEIRRLARWGGILLAILAPIGLLADLGGLTLRQWDEARLAVNALEMAKTGNWVVTTFGFEPDLWNTKPPLMIWLQAALIHLFGPNEWAIRLLAALAALVTVGLVYWFMVRWLRRPLGGLLASSLLLGSLSFIGEHHGHTGDYDALLTLAEIGMGLSIWLLLETGDRRWWLGVGAGLVVGTLTKGVAVLLPMPGILLYCLFQRRVLDLLRMPGLWLTAAGWLTVATAWYVGREHALPGYWAAVNLNELGGRFDTGLGEHTGPWYYYVVHLVRRKFLLWLCLFPAIIPFAVWQPEARARRAAWFALSWSVGLFTVLGASQTKLEWYIIPVLPWLALLLGLGGPRAASYLLRQVPSPSIRASLRLGFVIAIVLPPVAVILHELRANWHDSGHNPMSADTLRPGYGLRVLGREKAPPTPLAVVAVPGFYQALRPVVGSEGHEGYNAALRFYVLAYPRPVRVVAPAMVAALHGPGYVLTANVRDSALVRQAFPQAAYRAVGRSRCWLWTLPGQ